MQDGVATVSTYLTSVSGNVFTSLVVVPVKTGCPSYFKNSGNYDLVMLLCVEENVFTIRETDWILTPSAAFEIIQRDRNYYYHVILMKTSPENFIYRGTNINFHSYPRNVRITAKLF